MKARYLVLSLALGASSTAFGVTQGDLDTDSTGSADVTVTIDDLVRVTVEGDIGLTHNPGSNSNGDTSVCVYRNSNANVRVTFSSANPDAGNVFRMNDGGTNFIPYSIDFTGTSTSAADVASGAQITIADENNSSSNCGGVAPYSHDLDVTVQAGDLDSAAPGSYTDTVTIFAEPI